MFADYSVLAKVPGCRDSFSKCEAKWHWGNSGRIGWIRAFQSRFPFTFFFSLFYKERLLTTDFFSSRYRLEYVVGFGGSGVDLLVGRRHEDICAAWIFLMSVVREPGAIYLFFFAVPLEGLGVVEFKASSFA